MRISARRFDELAEAAWRELLASLPGGLRCHAELLVLAIQDAPEPEQSSDCGPNLLGLFVGFSLADGRPDAPWVLPPTIRLFRSNLMAGCSSRGELADEIRVTLAHERGHFFGFDEAALKRLGLG